MLDAPSTVVGQVAKTRGRARLEAIQKESYLLRTKQQLAALDSSLVGILEVCKTFRVAYCG